MRIGILHPGEMGSSIGAALVQAGHRALWVSAGRSAGTARRAQRDALEAVPTLEALIDAAECLIAICPPHAAMEQARQVMAAGFCGLYVDANAVAPETVAEIQALVEESADFVDGGVIGPPARAPGKTRLYLSGSRAQEVADLFRGSLLDAHAMAAGSGAASALKMCYAAWTKGSAALLMAVATLAEREGVGDALFREWQLSQPELPEKLSGAVAANAPKAWRFEGEMREIAATFSSAAMPDGFHLAAAEIYRRLAAVHKASPGDTDALLSLLAKDD